MVPPEQIRQGRGMDTFLAALDPWLIYLVVGALTFGESAAFLGLLLPGEIALVGAAAVAMAVGVNPVTLAVVAAGCSALGGWLVSAWDAVTGIAWWPGNRSDDGFLPEAMRWWAPS
jgi:hypothetical protein